MYFIVFQYFQRLNPIISFQNVVSFLCQINLADVKEYDKDGALPSRGMLYFFYDYSSASWGYDPDEQEDARVYYFEDTEGFVPLDIPDELYEAVWEERAMSTSSNNVMVNMLSLRKKLEDDPSNPVIIKTVWGKGYRFG